MRRIAVLRQMRCPGKGMTLLEVIVALALIGALVPALLVAVSAIGRLTDNSYDRSILFELAQSQMEDVQRQAFQNSPASYSLISVPSGYSITVTTTPATIYAYPAPTSTNTSETLQRVAVTVAGVKGSLAIVGYKTP